ncbi:hypothetical protein FDF86_15785 [Clostridium botulinum]|nr:hypothetical protein [Clostridium botulinum]
MKESNYFTKEYSVDTLIKGTKIETAICFLIDNSLDAAEKVINNRNNINIEIFLDENELIIKDNCIGISLKDAQETLLKIGEKNSFADLYGQGLKKAILIIGKKVNIKSFRSNEIININLDVFDNQEKDLWKPNFSYEYNSYNQKSGFSIKITEFTNKMNRFVMANMKSDIFTKLKNRISYKYRYIIKSKAITLKFNGENLEAKFVDADKVDENISIIDGMEVKVKLFKNIKDKDLNGIDFIVNDRCVIEKEKSKDIGWNLRIRKRGHSYIKFFGEVIIKTNDIEKLGINPSKNKINFTTIQLKKILDFMIEIIEKNRLAYKKSTISVQLEIESEQYSEWKEILSKQGFECQCAKELIDHLYKLGVNKIKENDSDFKDV